MKIIQKIKKIKHKFVETIPDKLEDGILYISVKYCTAIHKCICGCENEVVTPLSPSDWKLTFDGKTASLYPSIGNWSFECQSHYFITKNKIWIARKWELDEIKTNRSQNLKKKDDYYT